MKEPEISVGIVNAQEIHFSLNGNFFAKGETVCGEQQVAFSEGGILWNGNLYRELTFTPQDEHASFSLYDVTIGINFHWERQETQSFMGTLKLVVDEGKITAINILPTFSFSSLSYPYHSITALILFILLILRLNNFNPLPT